MFRQMLCVCVFSALFCSHLLSSRVFAAGRQNIVLITLDSTRADRMGFLGSKMRATPSLDALSRESITFEQAFSQVPLTIGSHATLLSGAYPQTHQVSEFGSRFPASLPFVPDLLHARGYHTAAFVGSILLDPKNGFAPGFDRGFEMYDADFSQFRDVGLPQARRGAEVVGRASAWLARNSQSPFFLWVNLCDPQFFRGVSYNGSVTAEDAAVGKLLAALRTSKQYENALIVVVSPHGESLGAHGEETHGIFLYEETLHVLLLMKLPQGQNAGKRVLSKVRLVDVAPTILEIAGAAVPSQMQGQSLLRIAKSSGADQPVYSRSSFPQQAFGWSPIESWRSGKYLYVRAPIPELYDLSTDPGATHNLAQNSKATLDTIAVQLGSFDRSINNQSGKTADVQLSSSEVQKLASLGYVGLQKPSSSENRAATGIDPKDQIKTSNLVLSAWLQLQDGKPEKAIANLLPVMPTGSNLYLAQYVMGTALAQRQQYAQAIQYLHRAIELQQDSTWAHYEMGLALLKTSDAKTAAVHLEIVSAHAPSFPAAHSLLAQAYGQLGRIEEAKRELGIAGRLGGTKP